MKYAFLPLAVALALSACQPPEADKPAAPASGAANSATGAAPAADGSFSVTVTDTACEPMEITVPSGKTTFNIKNASARALEWEILKGVMVVDERENILPNLSSSLTATLLPGEYEMTCGLLNNPRGKLIVTDSGFKDTTAEADLEKLAQPLAEYKKYVQGEAQELVSKTKAFTEAIKAGKVEEAKKLFASTRVHYERVEPIAELFNELDPSIDAREDDFKNGAKDDGFTGFHRLEYGLWVEGKTDGLAPIADRLQADVEKLKQEIDALNFPPSKVVGGANALIEEVAASKISGEEDRYSHTDLSDFQANIEGSQKIVELFRANIQEKDAKLLETVDKQFSIVNEILAKYKTKDGFETYDKLSEADRKALAAPINTLAEDLAKLRGLLGLD
ncbi:MAG: iron uptake system protein EfeO [Kingella sp. (in: b-proteobacteria)]